MFTHSPHGNIIGEIMQFPHGALKRRMDKGVCVLSTERFVKCRSLDFIVTADTCIGNVRPT